MRDWAKHTHRSPLYAGFCELIADDPVLLEIVDRIEHRPPPNLLFAGVQLLLFKGLGPDLAAFYPSLSEEPRPAAQAGPVFRSFVIDHQDQLVEMGSTRYTQTNECRRCVALLPLAAMSAYESFHLIDVGTSAGLNLAIDRYHYEIGEVEWGPAGPLTLSCESRGEPPALAPFDVLSRVGLDLQPVDASDPEERLWLEALVWPEHHERRSRLDKALELVSSLDITMVAGDALETLPEVLGGLPTGEPAVVMNSFSLIQFTQEERDRLERLVQTARETRPIHRVSMEAIVKKDDWAKLHIGSSPDLEEVGQAHPHGEWIELYARP